MSDFVFEGKNYYECLIDEAYVATAHGGVEIPMQYLTHRYQSQSSSALVQSIQVRHDTCYRVKESNNAPQGVVTPLHVPVRPCTEISMDVLKLTSVFIKCSTIYSNIELDNDHILGISHKWNIVDRHSVYNFLIAIPDNFEAKQCTHTCEVHLLLYIGYRHTIICDRASLLMSDHLKP